MDVRTDLERATHRELRRLPVPAAPATLLPRVMAAVQQWASRPWYERAWFTWPLGWQVISLAALVGLVGAVAVISPGAEQAIASAIAARAAVVTTAIAGVAGQTETVAAAGRVLWRELAAPLVPYAFALVFTMCLACAAFGAALNRVAFGRT